jgi:chromosomal replication initiation ATPase DnaA
MNLAATQTTARDIIRIAEKQIKTKTGMAVTLVLCPSENTRKAPEQMLGIIANALETNVQYFQQKGRKREIVELRFLSALLLRRYYPNITLKQIAVLFGGQDHTSVMNGLTRANELLDIKDPLFTSRYDIAIDAVTNWLKAEA